MLFLALGAVLRFGWWLSFPGPLLPDELTYSRAIRLVLEGESPYGWGGYLYPPLFALGCAWLWEALGREGLLAVLRVLNLAGAVVTVWCAAVWLPWTWRWRVVAGLGVVVLSPALVQGLTFGNVSLWVSGMLVIGLLLWTRHPVLSGFLLGASVAIKPLAPPAILVLAAHRPWEGQREPTGRRRWLAAGLATAIAAVLTVPLPHFVEWLELGSRASPERSVSFHRFPAIFGFEPHLLIVTGLVMAVALWVARARTWGRLGAMSLALVVTMAATPLVWSHTLVATLPLQAMALGVLGLRWRTRLGSGLDDRGRPRRLPLYEPVLVGLGVAALHLATGANTIYTTPWWLQMLGTAAPALAPGALLAYVVACREGLPEPWRREI